VAAEIAGLVWWRGIPPLVIRSGVATTYESDRVYLFVGNGDPRLLGARSGSEKSQFVYEVRPEGELRLDLKGGLWDSVSCESALIVACVCRPSQELDHKA